MHIVIRLMLALVVIGGVFGSLAISRGALAQQSANITVTAGISSAMSLTACDTTADFGNGLTALGAAPVGGQDQVTMSGRGNPVASQGVFYIWKPSCPAGQSFLTVESTLPWQLSSCATENNGSSSLSVAQGDLGWNFAYLLPGTPTYVNADAANNFATSCPSTPFGGPYGFFPIDMRYVLRIDFGDRPGTFSSTTTWTVSV
jgi:hypothetical protein